MKKVLKLGLGGLAIVVVLLVGAYAWATFASGKLLARTVETHAVDFPVPFPLEQDEIEELGLTEEEAGARALERARERGRHLLEARYGCADCHGEDFSGGVMVDAPIMGRLLGPNLTSGAGSRTAGFTPADWDRIVRHGVRADGRPSAMPSQDFQLMSDQELSDIIVYLESQPPVDNEVPPISLGPLGRVLVATGGIPLSFDVIETHDAAHASVPPEAAVSEEFGRHLAGVCVGCHGGDLAGGPIPGGDPSWAPAANLTPDDTGIGSWTYDDFVVAMREGVRPDGTPLLMPMSLMTPYAQSMTDTELEAMWTYLRSVAPVSR